MTTNENLSSQTPAQIDAAWFPYMAKTQSITQNLEAVQKRQRPAASVIAHLTEELEAAQVAEAPFVAEWNARGGWSRYYLVTNINGHVHTSTNCSTTFITTRFAVLADLSGLTGPEIVEAIGDSACSVCFPGAPVNKPRSVFTPDEKRDNEAKAVERAERAAKAAAKAAKSITMPDGSALRNEWGIVKTERSAEIEAVRALADDAFYNFKHPSRDEWLAYVERAIVALAAKRETTEEEQRKIITAKAAKKIAKG